MPCRAALPTWIGGLLQIVLNRRSPGTSSGSLMVTLSSLSAAVFDRASSTDRWLTSTPQTRAAGERRASVIAMVETVTDAFGGLDLLVNNAGIEKQVALLEMSLELWGLGAADELDRRLSLPA